MRASPSRLRRRCDPSSTNLGQQPSESQLSFSNRRKSCSLVSLPKTHGNRVLFCVISRGRHKDLFHEIKPNVSRAHLIRPESTEREVKERGQLDHILHMEAPGCVQTLHSRISEIPLKVDATPSGPPSARPNVLSRCSAPPKPAAAAAPSSEIRGCKTEAVRP